MPNAELHLHLEGSATPETLVRLARHRHGRELPLKQARQRLQFKDFMGFLLAFKWVSEQLQEPEDYAFLLRELLARLHEQNVLYAEITLSAGVVLWKKQQLEEVFAALRRTCEDARRQHPVEVRWIFDAVRNFGRRHVAAVAEATLRCRDDTVVAFGIGGDERLAPPERFREVFDKVRGAGLHVTVHAGETAGPESIRGAVTALGAERIGHGLAAFRDSEIVELLKERRVTLEVCPTSNLRTGALRQHTGSDDLARHPLVDYCRGGVGVTLNTDDPGLFECTLSGEYALAHRLGLSREELLRVAEDSFQAAFCSEETRRELLQRFHAGVAALPR